MILSRSSDTLWDVAAAEVRSRENRTDEEDAEEDAHFLTQRTVFFMGSKAGVCLQYSTTVYGLEEVYANGIQVKKK